MAILRLSFPKRDPSSARLEVQLQAKQRLFLPWDQSTCWCAAVCKVQDPLQNLNQLIADRYRVGILYPRSAALGGCAQSNALNFLLPPDSIWNHIVQLTGDKSWSPTQMRRHFMNVENNTFLHRGSPGHGFDGPISVSINV